MYNKLPVSSLESRAASGDLLACKELVTRSKAGLRRATLAIQRLLAKRIGQETRNILCEFKYSKESIEQYQAMLKPVHIDINNNAQMQSYPCTSGSKQTCKCKAWNWDTCQQCRDEWHAQAQEEHLEEITNPDKRTAQQVFYDEKGLK